MSDTKKKILITDTSVLINFLNINRIDLLGSFPGKFLITEHVVDEITNDFPAQRATLNIAIENQILTIISVNSEAELALFNTLMKNGRLGAGECSAIAYAINTNCVLVIDDARARRQAIEHDSKLEVLQTQDIIVKLIIEKVISVEEANFIKSEWQTKYRFAFKFKSFSEIIPLNLERAKKRSGAKYLDILKKESHIHQIMKINYNLVRYKNYFKQL